jgi:hypothetical protein
MKGHPHEGWKPGRPVDWWWDTQWGPDGNSREKGPNEDLERRVLVVNTGLTREQYVAWNCIEFITYSNAGDMNPSDVWVDVNRSPNYGVSIDKLVLCKEDTSDEERAELSARGFTFLGSRADLLYFSNPYWKTRQEKQGLNQYHTDTVYPDQRVRVIIHRGGCTCLSFHKNKWPSEWYWSRVGFDDKKPREPPVQPQPSKEELESLEKRREDLQHEHNKLRLRVEKLRVQPALPVRNNRQNRGIATQFEHEFEPTAMGRDAFMLSLLDLQQNFQKEIIKSLTQK